MSTPDPDDLITLLRLAAAVPEQPEPDLLRQAADMLDRLTPAPIGPLVEVEESEDAPLWRMARKEWSKGGLTTADVAAEGYQFNDRSCWADVAAAHKKVACQRGGGFERVGSALVAEFRRIFEPEPDQKG
jgi:hypothetical protein